ncbi:MAG: trypsin-like peptidase domain-containing protein [Clostridia bacterium]|nr:trypsin-like peptidase domain-containing protein [Clostridia bacterium]
MNDPNFNYSYNHQPEQNYYTPPTPPKKKGLSTGAIVAIVLAVALIMTLLGGCAMVGLVYLTGNNSFMEEVTEMLPGSKEEEVTPPPTTGSDREQFGAQEAPVTTDSLDGLIIGGDENALTVAQIYQKVAPSVVGIKISSQMGGGTGSGVVMTTDGYILTNAHVVDDAMSIQVYLYDGSEYTATLVGSDEATDIAVIKVDATGLSAATFGNSDTLQIGEDVVAIGNPLGLDLSFTVTRGIVSALNRNIAVGGYAMTLVQTDAAINPGNSGGPLINCYGEVIGITSAKIMSDYSASTVEGIGFAIPVNSALEVAEDLAVHGHVTGRPWLGIVIQTQYGQQGNQFVYQVVVTEVEPGSPAAACGMQVGDVIRKFGGVEVANNTELLAERDNYSPGDTVEILVERDGTEVTLKMTLGEAGS